MVSQIVTRNTSFEFIGDGSPMSNHCTQNYQNKLYLLRNEVGYVYKCYELLKNGSNEINIYVYKC